MTRKTIFIIGILLYLSCCILAGGFIENTIRMVAVVVGSVMAGYFMMEAIE